MRLSFVPITVLTLSAALSTINYTAAASPGRKIARANIVNMPAASADIHSQLRGFSQAAANADAKKMTSYWAEDGSYIDGDGTKYSGKTELEKRFAEGLNNTGKQHVEIISSSIHILSPNIAWVEGVVNRSSQNSPINSKTHFSMLMLKQNGSWLISSVTEIPISEPVTDQLSDIGWLVGNWVAEQNGISVKMKADWAANKKFIHCRYEISKPGQPLQIEMQIIGWDPRKQKIVSWHYDSNGGFSNGKWTHSANKWLEETWGVEQDGSSTEAINVLSLTEPDKFTWQSVNRSVDNVPVASTDTLTVKRLAN